MSDAGKLMTLVVALLALAPAVRAQSERPAPAEQAEATATEPAEAAEPAIALSRRGADLLRQGQHQQAAELFQQALGAEDGSLDEAGARAATRYNLALATASAGDPAAASDELAKLEADEMDPELRARARFNRGHALFTEAEKLAESDAAGAIDRYLQAAEAFRLAAALGGPEAGRAARNVEISRIAAQRLRDQIEREQERQEQAQQMAEQLRDLAERQQELADESQARAQSEQSEEANQDLQQRQDELRQQAEELQNKLEQMAEQNQDQPRQSEQTPEEGAAEDIRQAAESQDQATRDLGEQQPDDAAEAQQRAAELLRQAAERLGAGQQQQQQDGQQEGEQEQEGDQGQQAQQSQQEGEGEQRVAIAEALLDKERAEREARQDVRGQLGRIVPVEKDW